MPEQNGSDVCETFHQRFDAPVTFLTGNGDSVVDRQFPDEQSARMHSKPVRLGLSQQTVGESLSMQCSAYSKNAARMATK